MHWVKSALKQSSSVGEQKESYLNIKYILRQQPQLAGSQFNPWLWKLSWTPPRSQHNDTCKQLQLQTLKRRDAKFLSQIKNWLQLTELFYSRQQVIKVSSLCIWKKYAAATEHTASVELFWPFFAHHHTTLESIQTVHTLF